MLMLNKKIAQKIVDKTMSIVDMNVNIMNSEAIIIAAGDKLRIGDFHLGAYKVIKSGKSLLVNSHDVRNMAGVLPGITLPIVFKDKIIGAVGMTGEPELVIRYGELVRHTTELMIEQSYIKDEIFLEKRLRENFLQQLFIGNMHSVNDEIVERGKNYGLNLNQRHLVMVIKFDFDDPAMSTTGNEDVDNQRLKDTLVDEISLQIFKYSKIILKFIDDYLGVLIPLRVDNSKLESDSGQYKAAKDILKTVQKLVNTRLSMAIGGISNSCRDISALFNTAIFTLKVSSSFEEDEIKHFNNYLAEYAISFVPENVSLYICNEVLGNLSSKSAGQMNTLLQTLQIFYKCDMNITNASNELFIHRNSLVGRLKRIEEITGYNPQNFRDAVLLNIAMILSKMEQYDLKYNNISIINDPN